MRIITVNDLKNKNISDEFFGVIEYDNDKLIDEIITGVKNSGDKFLIEISNKFSDGNFNSADDFIVTNDEIINAYNTVGQEYVNKITIAKNNILDFAARQLECIKNLEYKTGDSVLGHKTVPLDRVLCYVPGGNYPLPSSCLMTVIPAKAAGVNEIYLTSPRIKPETIVAAHIAGADKIYKLGGAQAISAFAFGTETIKEVNKIVGPGNRYVTYAKKHVYGKADIDFLAGPSEVLIAADESADAKLIAADMLAQCEHDKDARSYLLTTSAELANNVQNYAKEFLDSLRTRDIAQIAFDKSFAVIADSIDEIIEITNKRAPEHLEIMLKNPKCYTDKFKNYGSMFIGSNCAEVFGDYVSGTNHVLPTNMASKYTGGLSVFDFIKILTYQEIDKNYARELSKTASYIAQKEGLMAHKLASDLRGENG